MSRGKTWEERAKEIVRETTGRNPSPHMSSNRYKCTNSNCTQYNVPIHNSGNCFSCGYSRTRA